MNALYKKIEHKQTFCRMLAFKLGLEKETVRNYLEINKIPLKHLDRINSALNVQLEFDKKVKNELKNVFKNI